MNNLDTLSASKFSSLGASSAVAKKQTVFGRIKSTSMQTATIASRIEDLTGRLFGDYGKADAEDGADNVPTAAVQQAFDDINRTDDDLARIVRAIAMLEELLP
jgi:hypothetical protein